MAGWDRNANWNRDVLERIVVLLFALAHLADRAAGAPYLRRRQLLGILSHGEAEAWAFVMGPPPDVQVPAHTPGEAADAVRLAASFRALALMLCAVLARMTLFARSGAMQARRPPRGIAASAVRQPRGPTPSAPDTS